MIPLADRTVLVTGASSGVGRATARKLAAAGARVFAVARDAARLADLQREAPSVQIRAFDATDAAALGALIDEARPTLIVHSAGVRPHLAPVHEHTWESFSAPWNTDVKIAFHAGQAALRRPLAPGSTVLFLGSGAALGGSPLSGGYAGAKRMMMFLAGYLKRASDAARLGIRFVALVPKQMIAGTEVAAGASAAYAAQAGITPEKFMERFGAPLTADGVADCILGIARGEIAPEATVIGVSGTGTEVL